MSKTTASIDNWNSELGPLSQIAKNHKDKVAEYTIERQLFDTNRHYNEDIEHIKKISLTVPNTIFNKPENPNNSISVMVETIGLSSK